MDQTIAESSARTIAASPLSNGDLAPTTPERRTWGTYAGPLLLGGSIALLIWGFDAGGGVGNVFSNASQLVTDDASFWSLFGPGLAANGGYWITLSMNIPDVVADPRFWDELYRYGIFVTFGLAAVSYLALSLAGSRERAWEARWTSA